MTLDELRYPTGKWIKVPNLDAAGRSAMIDGIANVPASLGAAVKGLTDAQLDTPYRPGGWTVRQLVHHVADSHMNGYIRLKLGLTEENPTIKPYDQDRCAELPDSRLPIEVSLRLLDSLHERWSVIWRSLRESDFSRTFTHPEIGLVTLDRHLQLYGWHSRHHVAHITALRQREGW